MTSSNISKIRFYLLFLFLLIAKSNALSQRCLTTHKIQQSIARNPQIIEDVKRINEFTRKWELTNAKNTTSRDILTIPIVIHIIYNQEDQNISEDQIRSQIEVLNSDFRKMNANFAMTADSFKNIAADTEIEFCLAMKDPDGNLSSGITRKSTAIEKIGSTDFWYRSDEGGADAWDTEHYLNIWVCDLGGEGALGFASMPGTADQEGSDGVVIDYRYFGTVGTAAESQPYHLGRITTHEVGHYFNLEHLWGPGISGCDTDDFVEDTPAQFSFSEACPSFPSYDDCTTDGDGLNYNNYMDYTDDECMTMFSEGQKLRMLATLNGPRATLPLSSSCSPSSNTSDISIDTKAFKVWPNPTQDFLFCEFSSDLSQNQWVIFDLKGNLVEIKMRENRLDLRHLKGGIYFLRNMNAPYSYQKFVLVKD